MQHDKREIIDQFQICGDYLGAELCKVGHINNTYISTFDQAGVRVRYVHQRINEGVFHDPAAVMRNITRVLSHLRHKLQQVNATELTRRCMTLVPARNGQLFFTDAEGKFWRTFLCVENVRSYDAVQSPEQAFQAGNAFGNFQNLLVDLPGERLHETIPDFHNSRKRYAALQEAIQKDPLNRAASVAPEISFALRHESMVDTILSAMARKEIPERITHNDTKFNNVLLDVHTGEAMCVVDLDTVMPGCVLYDFGDMVRTTTSPSAEDEIDLSKVGLQMPLFEKLAEGYLSAAAGFLTPAEKALIAFSGRVITFTIGLRFLTDHLLGDTYFRIHRPNHNLDRCRTQFKLVESIIRQEEVMQKFIHALTP